MRTLICIFCTLLLTGCITPQEAFRGVALVKQVGSDKVSDKWLERQERQVCSVGIDALKRRYGNNPTRLNALMIFCGYNLRVKE